MSIAVDIVGSTLGCINVFIILRRWGTFVFHLVAASRSVVSIDSEDSSLLSSCISVTP